MFDRSRRLIVAAGAAGLVGALALADPALADPTALQAGSIGCDGSSGRFTIPYGLHNDQTTAIEITGWEANPRGGSADIVGDEIAAGADVTITQVTAGGPDTWIKIYWQAADDAAVTGTTIGVPSEPFPTCGPDGKATPVGDATYATTPAHDPAGPASTPASIGAGASPDPVVSATSVEPTVLAVASRGSAGSGATVGIVVAAVVAAAVVGGGALLLVQRQRRIRAQRRRRRRPRV